MARASQSIKSDSSATAAAPRAGTRRRLTQAERTAISDRRMLDAAIELICTHGTHQTTLQALGRASGYSRGLVTYRFGSKAGRGVMVGQELGFGGGEVRARGLQEIGNLLMQMIGTGNILMMVTSHSAVSSISSDSITSSKHLAEVWMSSFGSGLCSCLTLCKVS